MGGGERDNKRKSLGPQDKAGWQTPDIHCLGEFYESLPWSSDSAMRGMYPTLFMIPGGCSFAGGVYVAGTEFTLDSAQEKI